MTPHPRVLSVGRALPEHHVDQETLIAALRAHWARRHHNVERLAELHRATTVSGRHLAVPLAAYAQLDGLASRNDAFIRVATELGERAVREALAAAGRRAGVPLGPERVGHVFFTTVTGLAAPSIDARLANRLPLREDVVRTPMFGLGCVAGVAGIARAADWLRAHPRELAVLLSVELCSLTLQHDDLSMANVIAAGLFGDGAAAVVLAGAEALPAHDGAAGAPCVRASRAVFYPDTERMMGWDVVDSGFRVVLSAQVPALVRERVGADVDRFLAREGLARHDLAHVIAHAGGPKVLDALAAALALPREALARSWRSLAEVGNLSSASVLFTLADHLDEEAARPGDLGLMVALGPAFCAELVLLAW